MCTREPRLVLVSLLIGWKNDTRTLNQSLSEVNAKPKQFAIYFRQSIENRSMITSSVIGSKFSRHFFNQSEVKPKPIVARACTFSRALCRLRVITSSFDWFTGLSPSFLIGQRNNFGFGFTTLETRSTKQEGVLERREGINVFKPFQRGFKLGWVHNSTYNTRHI